MSSISGVLDGVDYHQFYLVADEDDVFPEFAHDEEISPHGLIATTGHAVCVCTGVAMGAVNLTIDVLDSRPSEVDQRHPWAAVSETSFEATSTTAWVGVLMAGPSPPFNDAFVLAGGLGWYRVRAHAIGRELDYDIAVSDPREHHLLQLWQTAGPEPARHHRVDDQWANQGLG